MPRAGSNFIVVGSTPYEHEQAGIDFVREQLPERLHARALIDMFEPNSGRHYELDLVVIGWGAVFVVEMKDYEGRVEGDEHHWLLTRPGDSYPVLRDNPLSLTNHKCKVLKGKLDNYFNRHVRGQRVPFVQPLIFLSNPRVDNRLERGARTAVVDRAGLIDALQRGQFPNANPHNWRAINSVQRRGLEDAFDNIGLKPRDTQTIVNGFRLESVIADGPGYQDRDAVHEQILSMRARARVYLVPQHTTVDERDRLRRAARRESQLLTSVHDHQGILGVRGFADDAPLGPTLLFDDFAGGVPLDVFLEHEDPSFDERVAIFRQLGNALDYCHRREVIHGGLHPGAILVRRRDDELQVRLFNFQLGEGRGASATVHRTMLSSERAQIYQAPELAHDPRATSRASDCYSLGAVGYLLFTGQPPASSFANAVVRVQRDGCLDPAQVVDGLPDPVVTTLRLATDLRDRFDDAVFMVENLVSELRSASEDVEPQSTAHVLSAEKDDLLVERYTVERVLGYGASARVLQVKDEQDQRSYALKAARDPEQNDRLELEAEALRSFEHPRIVKLHDSFELDGLLCLKLSLAGEHTLHKQIAEEGGLSYELALRYGEDLLEALEQCEEAGLLHRDVKPANLGVGSATKGKKKHLTLFDFSLASAADDKLDIGTAAYRDPYLWAPSRGRWDAAADRWSAAITLHETLTGVRPQFVPEGLSPLDAQVRLVLAAERFDATRRDSLIQFFERALAREAGERFDSARAMKRAWSACFADTRPALAPAPEQAQTGLEPGPEPKPEPAPSTAEPSEVLAPEPEPLSDERLAKIRRSTPISALPLSVRAINALDRAGLTRTEELLSLPNNRLSAIRGIGSKVAREILDFRDRWRAQLQDRGGPKAEPFYPDYRGPELYLDSFEELSPAVVASLGDAGLHTTGVIARAPRMQVEAVLARVEFDPARLRELLSRLERDDATAAPTTLEAWIAALDIDGKKVADQRLRQMFGLEVPFLGRLDVTMRELVEHANVTRQAVTRNLADAIKRWSGQPWAPALRSLGLQIVDGLAGVAPMPVAAQALRTLLTHDPEASAELSLARCATLLRVAVELGADERERGLIMHRRTRGLDQGDRADPRVVLWLVSRPELWLNIDNLGRKADELARRPVLASRGETERVLELVVQNSPLSASEIGLSRLVELAAWASRSAAASSRLELYPLDMDPARALELSAQALGGNLEPAEVARRVRTRYPDAAPLPSRPALDRLLEPLHLRWNEELGQYLRPQAEARPSHDHSTLSLHRQRTVLGLVPGTAAGRDDNELLASEFEDEVRTLVQDRKLRVLAVNAAYLPEALVGLERIMGVRAVALDKRLIAAMDGFVRSRGGPPEVLRMTDAAGPDDGNWAQLQAVAKQAAAELARELLPPREPLLLIQPGLLARYELRDFIRALVEAASDDRSEAIVLLNPIHDGDRPDLIASRLPIPGLLPGQVTHVPRPWLRNDHRARAS